MTWPQVVILVLTTLRTANGLRGLARDKSLNSVEVALAFLFVLAAEVAIAGVLHAGGFW